MPIAVVAGEARLGLVVGEREYDLVANVVERPNCFSYSPIPAWPLSLPPKSSTPDTPCRTIRPSGQTSWPLPQRQHAPRQRPRSHGRAWRWTRLELMPGSLPAKKSSMDFGGNGRARPRTRHRENRREEDESLHCKPLRVTGWAGRIVLARIRRCQTNTKVVVEKGSGIVLHRRRVRSYSHVILRPKLLL
jgi:hypothetical protein